MPDAASLPGYGDRAVHKPAVWTWEIPVYFFVGGLAGMTLWIAAIAEVTGASGPPLRRAALWIAVLGAGVSPALLISDLGRPKRFLNMLRRFNPRSAMSMGVWILIAFSATSTGLLIALETGWALLLDGELRPWALAALIAGGVFGALLATYTAVLLGATVVPVWRKHRFLLPLHFAFASLGSAASLLLLLPLEPTRPLRTLLLVAVGAEVLLRVVEVLWRRHRTAEDSAAAAAALGGWQRSANHLLTWVPALLLAAQLSHAAGLAFIAGSALSRFAWVEAGKRV